MIEYNQKEGIIVNTLEQDLIKNGFVRDPNVSTRWYAGSQNILRPAFPMETHVDGLSVDLLCPIYGETREYILAMKFPDIGRFLEYCGQYGVIGINSGYNVWD
jgi:hypothetical protein